MTISSFEELVKQNGNASKELNLNEIALASATLIVQTALFEAMMSDLSDRRYDAIHSGVVKNDSDGNFTASIVIDAESHIEENSTQFFEDLIEDGLENGTLLGEMLGMLL